MAWATSKTDINQPENWHSVFIAALYFTLEGLILISGDIPRAWSAPDWLQAIDTLFWFGLLASAIAFAAGWVLGFPRWSYPYTAGLLAYSLYMMSTATPLLRKLGYLNQGWGWRAWLPFLFAVLVGLLFTRSLRPVGRFFANIRSDWTLATFAMFAWMPQIITIAFDEIDRLYSLIFKLLLTAVMIAVSVWYMRAGRQASRPAILAAGILSTLVLTEIAMIAYWMPVEGVSIPAAIAYGILIPAIMFSPALLGRRMSSSGGKRAQA